MALFEDSCPNGEGRGTLVCLPGVNSGAYLMEGVLTEMPDWRVLRLNPPGAGGMPMPLPFSVKAYARQVVETLNQNGVGKFVLLGHSLGGYAAQEVARMVPDRVTQLILVSTSRGQPDTALDIAGMQRRIGMNFWDLQQLIVKHEGEGHAPLFGPGFAVHQKEVFERFLVMRKRYLPGQSVTLAHLSAGGMFSSMGWVKKLAMPVLVIHGNADNLVSVDSGRKLAQALPQAQWLELYGVGHFPMLEYPSFWSKVRQFAEEAHMGMQLEAPEGWFNKMMKRWWLRG
jgi:pimeloyl-ACP methyl ester carboxylesterase